MREDKQREGGALVEDTASHAQHHDEDHGATRFLGGGALPPVAADGAPAVTASERAYGDTGYGGADSTMLGFGFDGLGPFGRPRVPTTRVPMTNEADLKAISTRKDVEALLGSDSVDAAGRALELVLEVPDSHRGKVIDGLADKAFERLLERVSPEQRERFVRLADVSHKPERKLLLWAEAHKSRAANNVDKYKGDIGKPIATYTWEDDDGEVVTEIDDDEEKEIRKKLTKEQLRNRKRHLRRKTAAETTLGEVDLEVKALLDKSKKGQLTLADVDEMRERKDLEYKVELDNNVNLTAETTPRANGTAVNWSKDELEQVQRTLPRLAHAQDPDSFNELQRTKSPHFMDGVGGVHHGDSIEIRDKGASSVGSFRHGGDKRQMVSDDFKQQHGEKITTLEFVLTHEIGHDAADKNEKAFEAFRKASGWDRVKVDAVRADGVDETKIAKLEERRKNPNAKTSDIEGKTKIFSPIAESKDEFWAVPITAIPAQDEAAPGPRNEDTWEYARVNPAEHFAEVYAKAVHVPEKLHDELIVKPTEAADDARAKYEPIRGQIDALQADPRVANRELKLANLRAIASVLKARLDEAEAAREQRAQQFAIMRNSVFGTDKAVKLSLERLHKKNVSADKIQAFQERAAIASTPEQVAFLEAEASK